MNENQRDCEDFVIAISPKKGPFRGNKLHFFPVVFVSSESIWKFMRILSRPTLSQRIHFLDVCIELFSGIAYTVLSSLVGVWKHTQARDACFAVAAIACGISLHGSSRSLFPPEL